MSGVQVPPPLPENFNEIDQIYQSHLIYDVLRIRFNKLICQSVCDQCVTEVGVTWLAVLKKADLIIGTIKLTNTGFISSNRRKIV